MKTVIAYDIGDDDARARFAAILSSHGARIQRSVFECFLDAEELRVILDKAAALMDHRKDIVHAFPVCETCATGRQALGQDRAEMDHAYWIVL